MKCNSWQVGISPEHRTGSFNNAVKKNMSENPKSTEVRAENADGQYLKPEPKIR